MSHMEYLIEFVYSQSYKRSPNRIHDRVDTSIFARKGECLVFNECNEGFY